MEYKIKNATKNDLDFVLSLNQQSLNAVSHSNFIQMNHFLDISAYFKILYLNNSPIGFLIGIGPNKKYESENYRWINEKYQSFIYVDRIIIDSNYTNKGSGTYFYNHLKNTFVGQFKYITCEVNLKPFNKQSLNFHKKYGFNVSGEQEAECGKKRVVYLVYEIN